MLNSFAQKAVDLARMRGINVNDPIEFASFMKDTMTGTRPTSGFLYENGPFSLLENEPVSAVITGGSPLLNWIPSRNVDFRYPTISHLEWVAPEGFDGSETYRDFLRSVDIAECDYGPTAVWSGFEYQMEGAEWSFQSPVMKPDDFGMRDFEKSPIYTVRGSNIGQPLRTDADWGIARALILMEQHMNYLVMYGDRTNSVMEYDGLDSIIQPGYVQSKIVGPGIPHWADPLVVNATTATDIPTVLSIIRGVVRKIRSRLIARNWSLQAGDMAIVMPAGMWPYVAEVAAAGNNVSYLTGEFIGQMNYRDFNAELARITQGGLGFGFLDVDGVPVPIIPDGNIGNNLTLDPGGEGEAHAVGGDIFVLTRRVNGMTLLEQQLVDWRQLNYPTNGTEEITTLGNGIVRTGLKMLNNACFQYYVQARGRLVSYFQPFQARINNVVVETLLENENEAGAFWSQDFYAYNGARGGAGSSLLSPL